MVVTWYETASVSSSGSLHDPDVVLLDEPYSGLDPAASLVLRDVLEELKDGRRTVVMVTHNLREGLRWRQESRSGAGRFTGRGVSRVLDGKTLRAATIVSWKVGCSTYLTQV